MFFLIASSNLKAQDDLSHDVIKTSRGDLTMYFVNHGTLMFTYNDLVIHVDPVSRAAEYSNLPKADLILITHHHGDHLDKEAIKKISKPDTKLILPQVALDQLYSGNNSGIGEIMRNGESKTILGIRIEAVPAYNLVHTRDNGEPYHQKGIGNGYVIGFADKRVYVAGDTENFPEMKDLKNISIAFLPMNLPYTMTPEMVADAVSKFHPEILYPYHYGDTDTQKLVDLLKGSGTEVRVRDFY